MLRCDHHCDIMVQSLIRLIGYFYQQAITFFSESSSVKNSELNLLNLEQFVNKWLTRKSFSNTHEWEQSTHEILVDLWRLSRDRLSHGVADLLEACISVMWKLVYVSYYVLTLQFGSCAWHPRLLSVFATKKHGANELSCLDSAFEPYS
jgi:hypothetical protein